MINIVHDSVLLTNIFILLGILLILGGLVVKALFILPLQFRNAHVYNGLIPLRHELLRSGVSQFILGVVLVGLLVSDIFMAHGNAWIGFRAIVVGVLYLLHAHSSFRIFRNQFSPHHQRMHKQIEEHEQRNRKS